MLAALCLSATVEEFSATGNALNGITLLSDSVADMNISPLMKINGLATTYQRPFNSSEIAILGLHNSAQKDKFTFGGGIVYKHHSDYEWLNPYLNVCYEFHGLTAGATGHAMFSSIDGDSESTWTYDLGLGYTRKDYGWEAKVLRVNTSDEQYSLTMKADISKDVYTALSYVYEPDGKDFVRTGVTTELNKYLALFGSWQNEPNRFGAGARFSVDRWSLLYSLRTHPQLDLTHAISVDIYW